MQPAVGLLLAENFLQIQNPQARRDSMPCKGVTAAPKKGSDTEYITYEHAHLLHVLHSLVTTNPVV